MTSPSHALIGFASGLVSHQAAHLANEAARQELRTLLGADIDAPGWSRTLTERLGAAERRVPSPIPSEEEPEAFSALSDLGRELLIASERPGASDREGLRRVGEALQGSGRVLATFARAEAERLVPATRWLSPEGRFQPWTARPWFAALDPATPWGRFLLLTLAACWEFPEPFEEGEGFVLWLSDAFPSADGQVPPALRAQLRAYRADTHAAAAGTGGINSGRLSSMFGGIAERLGLLDPESLRTLARYARLAAWLELPEGQHRLPSELIAALSTGDSLRPGAMLSHGEWNLSARLTAEAVSQPILALDFMSAAAAIENAFESLDATLGAAPALTAGAIAGLAGRLRGVEARYITNGGAKSPVISGQLPFVLRELRGRGWQIDAAFCCLTDMHVRRSLQRLYPAFFTGPQAVLSPEGTQWIEGRWKERWGEGTLNALKDAPRPTPQAEALLLSTLIHLTAPTDECLYELPLCYLDIVSHEAAQLPPSRTLPALVARKSLARGLKRLEDRLERVEGARERLQLELSEARELVRSGGKTPWWRRWR